MQRRQFMTLASSAMCLPMQPAIAAMLSVRPEVRLSFVDDRFALARAVAATRWQADGVVTVNGDVTDVWQTYFASAMNSREWSIQGVTTESFHFCLKVLLNDRYAIRSESTRLDKDLYLWTLTGTPIANNYEVAHHG
ncbi:MAG: hypothetical protein H6978_13795 [Gammaproteobacteria bacterium]|nr:hypothetical protein [Gammaproteobacteria bacterium]